MDKDDSAAKSQRVQEGSFFNPLCISPNLGGEEERR